MLKKENDTASENSIRKRKRRNIGQFPCSQCGKVFTRSDHLARHYLNHQPKQVYVCDHPVINHKGEKRVCGKSFVRKDLRDRHMRRHVALPSSNTGDQEESEDLNLAPNTYSDNKSPIAKQGNDSHESTLSEPSANNPQSTKVLSSKSSPHLASQQPQSAYQQNPVAKPPGPYSLAHPQPYYQHVVPQPITTPIPGQSFQAFQSHTQHLAPQISQPAFAFNYSAPMQQLPYSSVDFLPPPTGSQALHYQIPIQSRGLANQQDDYMHSPSQQLRLLERALDSGEMSRVGIPQSQNDIISWLFTDHIPLAPPHDTNDTKGSLPMDLKDGPTGNNAFGYEASNERAKSVGRSPQWGSIDNISHVGQPARKNSDLGFGLLDLNFFKNDNNPLETLFENISADPDPLKLRGRTTQLHSDPSNSVVLNAEVVSPPLSNENTHDAGGANSESKKAKENWHCNHSDFNDVFIDLFLLESLISALPGLSRATLESLFLGDSRYIGLEDRMSFYLFNYWEKFHPHFSILHRPSFCTKNAERLLILAMILVGAMYCTTDEQYSLENKNSPEYKLCSVICDPLRFTIFQHDDFKTPVRLWIVQSLNLLEWCEKNYLLRRLHERAHIHHGTTVQLLRRSPVLGGNPTAISRDSQSTSTSPGEYEAEFLSQFGESTKANDACLFEKWVESESLKRVTFMTFVLDTMDYIKFRHNPLISFYQLQLLNLPCDEEALWNSNELMGSFKKTVKRQRSLQKAHKMNIKRSGFSSVLSVRDGTNFLSALKKIIKASGNPHEKSRLSYFSKSIIFAGLVSLMHEMQQTELQNNISPLINPESNSNLKWKLILSKVLDNWECAANTFQETSDDNCTQEQALGQCKRPLFHLAQIIGMSDINHYDIAIFGGSPANMSVDASSQDLLIVQRKLNNMWLKAKNGKTARIEDLVNFKCLIHCYWLLWSLFLPPQNNDGHSMGSVQKSYFRVDEDIHDSMIVVSNAVMILWCYSFSLYGPESSSFEHALKKMSSKDLRDYDKLMELAVEDGHEYLQRIRQEFTERLRSRGHISQFLPSCLRQHISSIPLDRVMKSYCEILPEIGNKQNISGLCFFIGTNLLKSQWPILREYGKLIINCGLRSLGKKEVHCHDLFINDFED